jgi:hypothetical protein
MFGMFPCLHICSVHFPPAYPARPQWLHIDHLVIQHVYIFWLYCLACAVSPSRPDVDYKFLVLQHHSVLRPSDFVRLSAPFSSASDVTVPHGYTIKLQLRSTTPTSHSFQVPSRATSDRSFLIPTSHSFQVPSRATFDRSFLISACTNDSGGRAREATRSPLLFNSHPR